MAYGFKVGMVDARPVTAEVIELKPSGYRANHQLVGEPMSRNQLVTTPNPSIPIRVSRGRPRPAVVLARREVHLAPKAFCDRDHSQAPFESGADYAGCDGMASPNGRQFPSENACV